MNIGSFSDLASLFNRLSGSANNNQANERRDPFERSRNLGDSFRGQGQEIGKGKRAGGRKAEQALESDNSTVSEEQDTDSTNDVDETATEQSSAEQSKIDELAALYVKQYEEQSGVSLSEEAFAKKKADVAEFYASKSGGTERLDDIVFANDITEA